MLGFTAVGESALAEVSAPQTAPRAYPILIASKASTSLKGTDAQTHLTGSRSKTNLKGKVV